jgi:GNAT superfamily N-acetyltransferase
MQFELTEALIDDILFAMEDQQGEFLVDTRDGVVAGGADFADDDSSGGDRFIGLPEWDSSEGYRVMEHFAAACKSPVIRRKLSAALDRGKGVFRAFKDALGPHPEAERLWYAFKEREMKKAILRWYNALREEWGLERIGGEPEETEELVIEDFRFREAREGDAAAAAKLHRECPEVRPRTGEDAWVFPGAPALVAETGGGDFAAYVSAVLNAGVLRIAALEVRPEYRGLGIGKALLSRLLERIDPGLVSEVLIDLPAEAEGFSRVLFRESFASYASRYRRYIRKPEEADPSGTDTLST